MALSDLYVPGTIDSGGGEYLSPVRSYSAQEIGVGGPGPSAGDAFSVGKAAFKYLAPETYADATSWLPSWGAITSGVEGLFGGGGEAAASFMDLPAFGGGEIAGGAGGALGGAMAAFGPAAAFLAWAKMMAAINQNTDHPITLGSGYTSLEDGFYGGEGPKVGEARGLSDLYRGDGGWYAGGDPSKVDDDMYTGFGSMSWKNNRPFWSVGGARYSTPTLAVNSGREIARQQMGLPVVEESLPTARTSTYDPLYSMMGDRSLPVFDGAQQIEANSWDIWQERAQNSRYFQQANTEASQAWAPETIEAHVATMDPRTREWFDTALTTNNMYAYTGENSPDWGEINEYDISGAQDDTLSRVAAANEVNAPLFDPFTYAMGPGRVFNPARTNLRSGE